MSGYTVYFDIMTQQWVYYEQNKKLQYMCPKLRVTEKLCYSTSTTIPIF